jgi:uncharacterized protein
VYPAPPFDRGNWETRWIDREDVAITSIGPGRQSQRLHGWFCPYPRQRHVVLYSHGQSEHVASLVSIVVRLQDALDASVLLYDYRGYGKSTGRPTEAGCIADGLVRPTKYNATIPLRAAILNPSVEARNPPLSVATERGGSSCHHDPL